MASGVNPALFVEYPNIVDDSYATIGLTGLQRPSAQTTPIRRWWILIWP